MASLPHGQSEFPFLAAVRPLRRCDDCGRPIPRGGDGCMVCPWRRPRSEGEEYPGADFRRYAWVLGQQIDDPTAKLVLMALAHHDRPHGRGVFPQVATLARLASCSPRTVQRALRRLAGEGWLAVEPRRRYGRQSSSVYRIRQAETVAGPGCQSVTLSG